MGTITTDVPVSVATTKPKSGGADSLESEAVGLEVAVRIHGSQVTAVVLDATEHVEPFEEDTSTMIVFPRGAVVKLRARVRAGHALVLTHLATKQTALCRIIQVNGAPNIANYVKLEFAQPAPGFWGVHFPSDGAAPTVPAVVPAGVPDIVHEQHTAIAERSENIEAKATPVQEPVPTSTPSITQRPLHVDLPRLEPKPIVRENTKAVVKPVPAAPVSYGASGHMSANEIVPLAAAPSEQAAIPRKLQAAIVPPPPRAISHAPEAPIFDSLSTGEEVFGKESGLARTEETAILKSDHRATQIFARSLDPSSLMQSVEAPKAHTGMKIFLGIAAAAILAAGAVFYVRQYRGNTSQSANVAVPASIPQTPASTTSSTVPDQATTEAVTPTVVETSPSVEAHSIGKRVSAPVVPEQNGITITPVHNNGFANIYAGDLAARPQATSRKSAPVQTSVPTINGTPKDLSGPSANAGLSSLVSGLPVALPSPPKPVEEKLLVRGGIVSAPRLLHSIQPVYPALAMSSHIEGDVQIQALIDQTGKVVSTKAISGPVLLQRAAMDAVKQWRYSPATLDGKPTSMEYKVTVSFHLNQ